MKSLLIALILFALMFTIILLNAHFVRKEVNHYKISVQNLPPVDDISCPSLAKELKNDWERSVLLLGFSSCDNELRHVSELFYDLSSYAEAKDVIGFERTRNVLCFAISRIGALEQLEFEDIF